MSPDSIEQRKADLRAKYRQIRREISHDQRHSAEQAINSHIENLSNERKADRVAGYLCFDGEPDISAALSGLSRKGVEVNLPVITASVKQASLIFRRWLKTGTSSPSSKLEQNNFGVHEPVIGDQAKAGELDIVFMPLVAWDSTGGRLGMGAGYYDRALEDVADLAQPLRIGIAFEAQCAESLPMTDFDVRLHGIVTENGLFTFRV
jgi:5-formyltetrahydrofolate cyclo-ligase